ncbi:hypothetical protein DFH07DRAFT_820306 [Mycena maculata]|uniref:Uncharacterized protein n=1 Tax=Mycena maculata TaxID=230809 RepID=A0AAD7NEG2_9AGAR|nr:hypothetical protein DFH07DRAFT_820306 [Mycena maculata]
MAALSDSRFALLEPGVACSLLVIVVALFGFGSAPEDGGLERGPQSIWGDKTVKPLREQRTSINISNAKNREIIARLPVQESDIFRPMGGQWLSSH